MNCRSLLKAVAAANTRMVGRAAAVVNQALVLRNWLIGAYLVEYEQGGADRAKYGARLLERLAADLARRGIKRVDARTLRDCRMLFQVYPQIRGPLDPELQRLGQPIRPALAHNLPVPETAAQRATKRIRGPRDKDGTEVEFATAGMDNALFVSRYLVALPTVDQLRALVEADRARFAGQEPKPLAKK